MSNHYNYIIIGAGPAGSDAALALARCGKSVLLIEQDKWGGTCLHQGCIPTKALIYYSSMPFDGDLPAIFSKVFAKVTAISDNLLANLKRHNVSIINGYAQILDAQSVIVGTSTYSCDQVVFAGGSHPIVPNINGLDISGVYTSETIYQLKQVPQNLAIIGGGYIGFEWANIFNNFGSQVTIYETQPQVLASFDDDIRRRLLTTLRNRPLEIKTNTRINSFVRNGQKIEIHHTTSDTNSGVSQEVVSEVDAILIAVGRTINHHKLPEGVLSIGDASGPPFLAHKASAEGRALVDKEYRPQIIPSVMFTDPEIATTGVNETELKQKNLPYSVIKLPYRANSKALVTDKDEGFVKLITDTERKLLLGAAIIGYEASNIINVLTLAIQEHIPVQRLKYLIFPHPTIGEIIGQAIEAI